MRRTVDLFGVVQGVGLRPTVVGLARGAGLTGSIQNRSGSVRLTLEGPPERVEEFLRELPGRLRAPARVDRIERVDRIDHIGRLDRIERFDRLDRIGRLDHIGRIGPAAGPAGGGTGEGPPAASPGDFVILESAGDAGADTVLPTDLVTCADCLAEVRDPNDRRFGYPFTTCTRCGPRYTVVRALPYDRERTTLADFPLCAACAREYQNEGDRRFHAESIACPACGPRLNALDASGAPLTEPPLPLARAVLARGEIVAVRGIGGFLLAAHASDASAVARLRERKRRPHKPLAVMAADLATVERWCRVEPEAAELLTSPGAPIVILDRRPRAASELPVDLLTPDAATLGVMLPTSPLHHLLLAPLPGDPTPALELLVMTSGNRGGEPICTTTPEAIERLAGIADLILTHDREINLRCDDSVCVVARGVAQPWRRARGWAPAPIRLGTPLGRPVLAMGSELKNAVAVGRAREVVLSPHVGDLDTPEGAAALERACRELPAFLRHVPEVIAVDQHPDYRATRHGRALAEAQGVPVVEVQHHHAHARSAMAEHDLEEALALVFDGTGLGTDGAIWGAELLHVVPGGFTRLGSFADVPLPGGDQAVREPVRQWVARLWDAGLEPSRRARERLGLRDEEIDIWRKQCERGLNAPRTHAAGRLFDAVAVAVGLAPARITYDAQAAIRLEAAARRHGAPVPPLPFDRREASGEPDAMLLIDWRPTVEVLSQNEARGSAEETAAALQAAIAEAALELVRYGRERTGLERVVLSGGVFCNRWLAERVPDLLGRDRFAVHSHQRVPPNDGGLALGQAVIAGS